MSLKLRLNLDLFINKQTWTNFLLSQARVVHDRLGSFTALIEGEKKKKRWKRQMVGQKQEEEGKKRTWKEKKWCITWTKKQENIIKLIKAESNVNGYIRFSCSMLQKEGTKM